MTQSTKPADYRVVAKNTSSDHVGSIHDDSSAKQFGYAGGLVPGITLYGYMTHVLAEAWGEDWIKHGTMSSRSIRPAYEGETVTISVTEFGSTDDTSTAEFVVTRDDPEKPLAVGAGSLPSEFPIAPAASSMTLLPMPDVPPLASVGSIPVGFEMGTTTVELTDVDLDEYLGKLGEDYAYYRERRIFPPSYLQQLTTHVERANFQYETPTIYVASSAQHFREIRVGDVIQCPGIVTGFHERKGNHYVDVEQLVISGDDVLARVTRDSIYHARDGRD